MLPIVLVRQKIPGATMPPCLLLALVPMSATEVQHLAIVILAQRRVRPVLGAMDLLLAPHLVPHLAPHLVLPRAPRLNRVLGVNILLIVNRMKSVVPRAIAPLVTRRLETLDAIAMPTTKPNPIQNNPIAVVVKVVWKHGVPKLAPRRLPILNAIQHQPFLVYRCPPMNLSGSDNTIVV